MVAESYDIARETYLAILMDRSHQGPVIVGSPKGGVDIFSIHIQNPCQFSLQTGSRVIA